MQRDAFELGDRSVAPGTKGIIALPVTTDLDGTEIRLFVHVIAGAEPGPVLTLLSTLHGSEFLTIEMTRRFVTGLDPATLKGTVLAVPVGNPVALQMLTRNTPDESDAPDLNRVFPGQNTWIAEQLARIITTSLLQKTDYLLDFHMGLWGSVMGIVTYGIDFDEKTAEESYDLALAFGYPSIKEGAVATGFPGPSSARGYAGAMLKVPSLGVNIGGAGFDRAHEELWLKQNLDGIRNVMIRTHMLDGTLDLPKKYLLWRKRWRVNPSVGGYLLAAIPPSDLMRKVSKGELLATVVSPYTFEVLEELTAPGEGIVTYTARDYPVRPGDWGYGIIDLNDPHTRWIDNPLADKASEAQ